MKKLLVEFRNKLLRPILSNQEKLLILNGRILSSQLQQEMVIDDFSSVEYSVHSQWGEDGIIDWLISRIPSLPRYFVEFGVENYIESNTRYLLQNRNWSGLIIDGSRNNISDIHNQPIMWRHDLTALSAFIDRSNINSLLNENIKSNGVGLLSIDIDGNDYWIWEKIDSINPGIVVCEYNALWGDIHSISVPYSPDFNRTNVHYSNLYYGSSIKALILLAKRKIILF